MISAFSRSLPVIS